MTVDVIIKTTQRPGAKEPNTYCSEAYFGGFYLGSAWGSDPRDCERRLKEAISRKLKVGVL